MVTTEGNNTEKKSKKQVESEDIVDVGAIFRKLIFHWPLFLIMCAMAVGFAYLYLRYTRPIFASTAKIYIKDEKKTGGIGRQLGTLQDLGFTGESKLVENEMEVIKSPLILKDVIRENQFNIRYYGKGRVTEYELYDQLPIKLNILTDSSSVGNYLLDITKKINSNIDVKYLDEIKGQVVVSTRFNEPFTIRKDRFSITYNPSADHRKLPGFLIRIDSITQLAYVKADELTTSLVNKQSSVFQLGYQDPIGKRAADFLNAVVERYNQYTLEDKNLTALTTIKFIETRLQSLGGELGEVERNVETFKKSRGITQIEESSQLFLEQIKEADQKLGEANIQLSVYDQIERYINNPESNAPFAPIVGNIDQALSSLITRYQELQSQKRQLSLSLQPNNEIFKNLDQQLKDARSTVRSYIAGYRRNAVISRAGIQRKVAEIEGMIAQVPGYERQFINLKREQSVKEALYIYLLQKREETSVSYASNIVSNKIISPAFIPLKPVSPNRTLIYLGFLGGAMVLTSLYIYLKYLLNSRLTTKKEIESMVDAPVLAEISMENGGENPGVNERGILSEQILNLRNNLKFLLNNVSGSPVILFTSSISGEGKTFLSSRLGSSLASNNKKVIMLELDLRKPKLAKSLGISNNSGITNYILGDQSLDGIIKKVPGANNVYLIPSGPIPPNPIEMLESEKMTNLFVYLKQEFDFILIDTSPIGLVSDAKSLAKSVDCALFVVRFNYTPKTKLRQVSEETDLSFFKKIGYVFNGIDTESSYSQNSYGYSSYGYGYGAYGVSAHKKRGLSSFFRKLKGRLI